MPEKTVRELIHEADDLVLAPVRLSLPSKILGGCFFFLAWVLLPTGPVAHGFLALSCGCWVGSELCRMRRFAAQEWMCKDIMSRLSVSAFYVSRARTDNLRELKLLAEEVVAVTTQTPSRFLLESLVITSALWLASILPGILWEIGIDIAIGSMLASLSGSDWLERTARLTDDAELRRLISQLAKLDKALTAERANKLTDLEWRERGFADDSPWSDVLAAARGVYVIKESGEALLLATLSFAGALILWWLLRRSAQRRYEHRMLMTKARCVDLLINLMGSEREREQAREGSSAAVSAGTPTPDSLPAPLGVAGTQAHHRSDAPQLPSAPAAAAYDLDTERRKFGEAGAESGKVEKVVGEEGPEAAAGSVGEAEAAAAGVGESPENNIEDEYGSARAKAAPRLDVDDGEEAGGRSVSQLAAASLAHIAHTSDAAISGPGLLEVANVERLLSLMAAPSCDLSTTESLTLALQEVLAAQQPAVVLLALVKVLAPRDAARVASKRLRASQEEEDVAEHWSRQTDAPASGGSEGEAACALLSEQQPQPQQQGDIGSEIEELEHAPPAPLGHSPPPVPLGFFEAVSFLAGGDSRWRERGGGGGGGGAAEAAAAAVSSEAQREAGEEAVVAVEAEDDAEDAEEEEEEEEEDERLAVLRYLGICLKILPKQCSNRVRLAVSHTGLVGSLLHLIWGSHERTLVLRPVRHTHASAYGSIPRHTHPSAYGTHPSPSASSNAASGARRGTSTSSRRRRAEERAAGGAGGDGGGGGGGGGGGADGGDAGTRRRIEILASNILVRLATQLEWESADKSPVLDEASMRLCVAIVEDPCSKKAETAAVLLAVITNTMVNSMAHMRLFEPAAETMPLRLEQVRLDLRKLRSEPSLVLPRAHTILQGKMLHFAASSVPCLAQLLVSEAGNTAKAAAALCLAFIALLQPSVALPAAALEAVVALLDTNDASAILALEALAALVHVPSTQRFFDEQGVVEMAVRMARRGGAPESLASAAAFLELLATRRRLYRSRCREAGAIEVLQQLEVHGQASVRDAAAAATKAVSRTIQEDVAAAFASTGYLVLVIFCFFLQLGGVHAVMDVLHMLADLFHLLSRITSVRRQLPSPSAVSIALDFLINEPLAFVLLAVLLALVPPLLMYLYLSHQQSTHLLPPLATGASSPPASASAASALRRHRSWLLGFTVRQEVVERRRSEGMWQPERWVYKYVISQAMPDGPCKRGVRDGDLLLAIDGHTIDDLPLERLKALARGTGRSAGTDPLVLRAATYLSSWLDPLRRLVGMRVEARAGRGSRALLTILRTKKDGRRQTREVSLIRGNWGGALDDAGEEGGGVPAPPAREGATTLLQWLRDLRTTDSDNSETAAAAAASAEEDETGSSGLTSPAALAGHAGHGCAEDDERVCRICQCSEEEVPEYGKLFSPCLCRGTMRYIHQHCLDKWRKMSANASSNTQCDQCFYVYRVERRGLAKFVRVAGVREVGALAVFFCSIVLAGFLIKWGRLALHLPISVSAMVEAGEEAEAAVVAAEHVLMLDAVATDGFMGEAGQSLLTERWPNIMQHLVLGATGVGIVGFSTLVILLPMRGLGFIGYHPNLLKGTISGARIDPSAAVVLAIVVVAGLIRALYLSYKLTDYIGKVIAERSGTLILPADLSNIPKSCSSLVSRRAQH